MSNGISEVHFLNLTRTISRSLEHIVNISLSSELIVNKLLPSEPKSLDIVLELFISTEIILFIFYVV